MTYEELKQKTHIYGPALALDRTLSPQARRHTRRLLEFVWIFCLIVSAAAYINAPLLPYQHIFAGVFLCAVSLWFLMALLQAMYNSYYYIDIEPTVREGGLAGASVPLTFETATILRYTNLDATEGFAHSPFGTEVMSRLGIAPETTALFLGARTEKIESSKLYFTEQRQTASEYAKVILAHDHAFADFLFTRQIQARDFEGACNWVSSMTYRRKRSLRWWGRENLGKIPSIGREWSYGRIYTLRKYSREISEGVSPQDAGVAKEVEQLEAILVRAKEANALIVSDLGSGERDILYGLVGRIQAGTTPPPLEGKHLYEFDASLLIDAAGGDKATFETQFQEIMQEATSAGNIIIAFADLPGLVQSAKAIGTDVVSLLYPYLTGKSVQIIAVADKERFHAMLEQNGMLMNSFEVLRLGDRDERMLTAIMETEVLKAEAETGLYFTYQAVEAVAQSAARYFSDGVPLDKAKDLLVELPAAMASAKKLLVERDDVLALTAKKTGIPQEGQVSNEEKEKLLHLEETLRTHIVGQKEAIDAVANTMRRARAGLRNPNRPIGSFLFLGPTGVGKTETAKTLAEVFFGASAPMLRLDMSEYTGADALARLIGSFEGNKTGTLSSMLRDQKYGVLLLDEFEKTTPEVHNLFLQVLDEGFFSDMHGKKVNARNVIIIATSNAGSDRIFSMVEEGKDLVKEKAAFIDALVASGRFKPELINRFDGVILFHPLDAANVSDIAKLAAEKLKTELAVQGFRLVVTSDLTAYLAREGFDPKFGARAMNRVLQEKVEKLLAEGILNGAITKGATLEFVQSPLEPDQLLVRSIA